LTKDVFTLRATGGGARAGVLRTAHGDVPTPAFMSVATQGSVKALDPADLKAIGANIILGNTYHLYLRPGVELVERFGGLHRFMGWNGPILTDSGGFQGFSLEPLREMTEEGITFKSHLDGSLHTFTPETVVQHQKRLGSDIAMPLDVCVALPAEWRAVEAGVERTSRWAERSLKAHEMQIVGAPRHVGVPLLFGIVQGGVYPDLRQRSAEFVTGLGFPGYGIGGLSVGESKEEMYRLTGVTAAMLPSNSPRYLMGVGSPEDLVECVARGIDMFDCVLPTRTARNGALYVPQGRLNIDAAPFRSMERPVQEDCDCYTCQNFSAAYLHHLFKAKELLAYRLATLHNLRFVLRLMEEMRSAIVVGAFAEFRAGFLAGFVPPDEEAREAQRGKWLAGRSRRTEEDQK
jgi:queuine tRNA-ribosyltransferase